MAFASLRSSTTLAVTSATTQYLLTLPSPIAANDRIVVGAALGGANNNVNLNFNGNGNWGIVSSANQGTVRLELWAEQAVGNEAGTVVTVSAATIETAAFKVYVFQDDTTQGPEVATSVGVSSLVAFSPVTPTGGAKDYVYIGLFATDADSVNTFSSGYGNTGSIPSSGNPSLHYQRRNRNAASEEAGDAILSAADQFASMMIAVHPGPDVAQGLLLRRRRA